jgi:AcrR family transcriptional regulator
MPRAFSPAESNAIRARLLEVGRGAIASIGLRKTTIGSLARGAGISQGAYYLFFDSKEALLIEVLRRAEADARRRLDEVVRSGTLQEVIATIFAAIPSNPLLLWLADPDELGWLVRVLGPTFMTEARASDEAYFAGVWRQLRKRGLLAPDVDPHVFDSLALVALGVAQQREALGEVRFPQTVRLLVEATALRLSSGKRSTR